MAENNKHDNDKNENIEALKSAAANKAVKTAATFGANAGNVAMSLGKDGWYINSSWLWVCYRQSCSRRLSGRIKSYCR